MTVNREDLVTAVVAAAGGKLTSRVRLQKSVYLLDRLGFASGFDFDYHHYGPFSRDLENATEDATAFDLVVEEFGTRQSDGARYSVFTTEAKPPKGAFGDLGPERTGAIMGALVNENVTVLELAATVDWLWRFENRKDWQSEVRKRKGVKAKQERLDKAVQLLTELGLKPPQPAL